MSFLHDPIVVACVSSAVTVIIAVFVNSLVIRPKFCKEQQEKCKSEMRLEHDKYVRADVLNPQISAMQAELKYIRAKLDQLYTRGEKI